MVLFRFAAVSAVEQVINRAGILKSSAEPCPEPRNRGRELTNRDRTGRLIAGGSQNLGDAGDPLNQAARAFPATEGLKMRPGTLLDQVNVVSESGNGIVIFL